MKLSDCGRCVAFATEIPYLVEAVASVAMSRDMATEVLWEQLVRAHHRRGHPREEWEGLRRGE